jgi:hypothetical protein
MEIKKAAIQKLNRRLVFYRSIVFIESLVQIR